MSHETLTAHPPIEVGFFYNKETPVFNKEVKSYDDIKLSK